MRSYHHNSGVTWRLSVLWVDRSFEVKQGSLSSVTSFIARQCLSVERCVYILSHAKPITVKVHTLEQGFEEHRVAKAEEEFRVRV